MFWNVIKEHEVSLAKKSDRSLNKLLVKIEKVARTRTCDEDSIQKILISVFKSIDKFDQNKGDFNHWLSRLITNQLRKDYNKNNSDPHLFLRFEYDNEENEDLRLIVNQPEIKEEQKLKISDLKKRLKIDYERLNQFNSEVNRREKPLNELKVESKKQKVARINIVFFVFIRFIFEPC